MGAYDFSIDPDLVEHLLQALPLTVFVETGTFEGEAVERMLPFFAELHSIEIASQYHAAAVKRFRGKSEVALHLGDSPVILEELQPALREKAVLYWLDAHWCEAEGTGGETAQCPLLHELGAIGRLNRKSAVLIDDARLFLAPPPAPHEISDWPRCHEVLQNLLRLSPNHEIMVVNDVIAFYPEIARRTVAEYAHTRGTDLLAQTHRVGELEREYAAQSRAATERLEALEELSDERDRQAQAAEERLALIEELTRERDAG